MTSQEWPNALGRSFPGLAPENCQITSPADDEYNCIAWAAGDSQRWWWPDPMEQSYWPSSIPRVTTVEAFVQAFSLLGYSHRTDATPEAGRRKIAIFVDDRGTPTHAARLLDTGRWTSKLGRQVDVVHDLSALEGSIYGKIAVVLASVEPADDPRAINER